MFVQPETQDIFKNIPAEQLCAFLRKDQPSLDWLEDLNPSEWQALVSNAIWFGLGAVCYLRLKSINKIERLPFDTYQKLRNIFLRYNAMSVLRESGINDFVQKMNSFGIPVILLKGAHLAEEVYPDPAMRQMIDLDFLVPREDIDLAAEILLQHGYNPVKPFWTEFETSISHQLPTFTKSNHLPIELHWTLLLPALPYQVDLEGLWQRARTYSFLGTERLGLSPEDLIMHLSIHAAMQHKLTGSLRLVYDIAMTLSRFENDINWDVLAERARQWNAKSPLFLILQLTKNLFGGTISENFLQLIKPIDYEELWINKARDLLMFNQQEALLFSRNLASVLEAKDFRQKIKISLNRFLLSPEKMAEIYPVRLQSTKLWLYYPIHMKNLMVKHFHSLLGYWKHDHSIIDSLHVANLLQEREDYLDIRLTK